MVRLYKFMKSRGFTYSFFCKLDISPKLWMFTNQVTKSWCVLRWIVWFVKVPRCCKNSGQTQWIMAASTSTIAQRSGQTLSVWISQLPIVRFKKCAADGVGTVKAHNFQDVWVLEGKRESPYEKKASLNKNHQEKTSCQNEMLLTNVPSLIITSPLFFQLLVLNFSPCWICPMHLPVLPSAALVGAFKLPPYPKWTDVHGGCPVLPDDRNSSSGAPRKTKGQVVVCFGCFVGKETSWRHWNQHFCRKKSIMLPCNTFLWGTEVTSSVTIS